MSVTYVLHSDGWAVGWWDAKGRWMQHSKHRRRADAVAAVMEIRAKEKIDVLPDTNPTDHDPVVGHSIDLTL